VADATFSNFSVARVATSSPAMNLLSLSTTDNDLFKTIKNIFLQFTWNGTPYNYAGPDMNSGYSTSDIQPCVGGVRIDTGVPTKNWCSILPTISNIRLANFKGTNITPDSVTGTYFVKDPGFYTLRFGTTVDKEQTPISKMLIDFGEASTTIISIPAVDSNNNFYFSHYYNPPTGGTQYHIRIKVADNWGFYSCVGLSSNCSNPSGCCIKGFNLNSPECENCLN